MRDVIKAEGVAKGGGGANGVISGHFSRRGFFRLVGFCGVWL